MNTMLQRVNRFLRVWAWLALIWPVGALGSVRADEVAELRAIIRQLQQENQEIRERLLAIEKRLSSEAEPKTTPPNKIGDQTGRNPWRKLKIGMEADRVVELLGEPEQVNADNRLTFWYYKGVRGGVSTPCVTFRTEDMTIYAWKEP